ncbi:MAG: hypothetical protein AAFN08_16115, partial [Cyanobacteria bacterium J06559_3]
KSATFNSWLTVDGWFVLEMKNPIRFMTIGRKRQSATPQMLQSTILKQVVTRLKMHRSMTPLSGFNNLKKSSCRRDLHLKLKPQPNWLN